MSSAAVAPPKPAAVAARGPARFVTTLLNPDDPEWDRRATMIDRGARSIPATLRELVRAARRHEAAVLLGAVPARAGYVDLLAAACLARAPEAPLVVLSECTWEPGSRSLSAALEKALPGIGERLPLDALTRRAVTAIDGPRVIYCVLSEADRDHFIRTWSADPERVVVTPFSASLEDHELERAEPRGPYVFAGGDPLRDYPTLAAAARGLGAAVHIAARRWAPAPGTLPPNVRAGPLAHEEFVSRLSGCGAVAVPLSGDELRSAGQQTFLNAMGLRRPVVITDALGVREYVTHREHALIVPPGDARAMREALVWVLDPANAAEVDAMTDRAHALVNERHRFAHYEARLMAVVDQGLARRGRGAAGG